MKVKATTSFSGTITMAKDDIKDIQDGPVLSDLLRAGYVVKAEKESKKTADVFSDGDIK